MLPTKAYAATSAAAPLTPLQIERREPGANDVLIEILYCGICHSDISFVAGHFPFAMYPMVPGHEIVGRVSQVGDAVKDHRVGEIVGVGCMVDSCRTCAECHDGEEQFCDALVPTYAGVERDGKTPTFGGYSTQITVNQNYVVKISPKLSPAAAAPLLCAGITTYSPLRHAKVGKGSKVAIIGLGGLGHVAVKLAKAMGAEVTVLSRGEQKRADALALGASDYAASSDPQTFTRLAGRFDLILNTVSGNIDSDAYLSLLRRDGALVFVGVPESALSISPYSLMMRRKSVLGSAIGGIRETQEMLDFCAEHGIVADIEVVDIKDVNASFERILKSDIRYRFVIDMATLA